MTYHELSTQKFYHDSLKQEIKAVRRQKNKEAVQAFMQFLFFTVVMMLTTVAVHQMPNWLPTVTAYMDQYGINEAIQTWIG